MLPSNVQKCYGCGAIFSERFRSAPCNLCIKHVDKRVLGQNADGHLIYSRDYTRNTCLAEPRETRGKMHRKNLATRQGEMEYFLV